MFFHRHKGDLRERQGEPRELRLCGSHGKQEKKRECNPGQEKRTRERKEAGFRDVIFTRAFLCVTSCQLKSFTGEVELLNEYFALYLCFTTNISTKTIRTWISAIETLCLLRLMYFVALN